ncbi:NmrA family NAD(P)-binding protein [Streptomyces sp. NPDC094034]|uniref:NmrA family NAD(P)-binding protein n=1 Tax=Streptomyces sp. NPDC094034 TaxID=3155309 RepID=UPI00332880F8
MTSRTSSLPLIVGGKGKTGSRVVSRLRDLGKHVRIGSRSGNPPFSWADQSTWAAALDGVDRVYVVHPDLVTAEAIAQVDAFATAAVERGVTRLVLLSGYSGEANDTLYPVEQVVVDAGAEWTIVRPSWFNQNFSEDFFMDFLDAIRGAELAYPFGEVKIAYVDADDIAAVATAALTEDGHNGKIYNVTGPESLSLHDVARELSTATGQQVAYTPLSAGEYAARLREHGTPQEIIDAVTSTADRADESVAHDVREVLGREPISFTQFARATAATGIWQH